MDLKDFTENEQEEIEKGLSKSISKQSVAIWYALTALHCYIYSRASYPMVFPR